MTTTLTENDLPSDATYTTIGPSLYIYHGGACKWVSPVEGFVDSSVSRHHCEVDITRDEAIAILKARGQLAAPAEPRPFHVGDRVRVVRKATRDEMFAIYAGTIWAPQMDKAIGCTGKIAGCESTGFRVDVKDVGRYLYPACVLAHADEPVKAVTPVADDDGVERATVAAKPRYGGPHDDAAEPADTLGKISDVFGIGSDARTASTILQNVTNAARRSQCLSAIEHEFLSHEVDEDGDVFTDCPMAWGATPEEYVNQFRNALYRDDEFPALRKAIVDQLLVEPLPAATPAQPDPLADLRRRVEALEAKLATTLSAATGSPVVAPPVPPVPEVPECGYWERDGKRYVLTEPVEWRRPKKGDWYVSGRVALQAGGDHDHPGDSELFILRELVEPTPPQGYEIDGWRKPKAYEAHTKDGTQFLCSCNPQDYFAWCLRPKPTVRRKTETVTFDFGNTSAELPFVNTGDGWKVDCERIALEWVAEHHPFWLTGTKGLVARLAEIREGKR